jgi:hypothetical protein
METMPMIATLHGSGATPRGSPEAVSFLTMMTCIPSAHRQYAGSFQQLKVHFATD